MAEGDNILPGDAPSGGGAGQWLKDHKYAAIGGGAVLLLAAFVWYKRKQAAASSSGASGSVPGAQSTGGQIYEIAPGYLGSDYGYGMQQGYGTGIQAATGNPLSQGQTVTGTTVTSGSANAGSVNGNAATAPVGAYSGSGYLPPSGSNIVSDISGSKYEYIGNPNELTTDINRFGVGSIFAEPTPGVFSPSQGVGIQQQYAPGTPQYLKVA